MSELKFASVEEAVQHLANVTCKQVRVALMGPVDPKFEQELKNELGLLFKKYETEHVKPDQRSDKTLVEHEKQMFFDTLAKASDELKRTVH